MTQMISVEDKPKNLTQLLDYFFFQDISHHRPTVDHLWPHWLYYLRGIDFRFFSALFVSVSFRDKEAVNFIILMSLPPLPLPFCSSNTSSYLTHQNGSGKSCNQWSMIKRATQICLCTYARFTITKVTSMWAGATIKWFYQTLSQNQ